MWTEQICCLPSAGPPLKNGADTLPAFTASNYRSPLHQISERDLLAFLCELVHRWRQMTKYLEKILPNQWRKKSPRGTHLTSIPLLSGRHKAEGHALQLKERQKGGKNTEMKQKNNKERHVTWWFSVNYSFPFLQIWTCCKQTVSQIHTQCIK